MEELILFVKLSTDKRCRVKVMAAFEPWIALIPKIHLYPYAPSALDCGANKFHSLLKSIKVSRRHGMEERQRIGFDKRGDLIII